MANKDCYPMVYNYIVTLFWLLGMGKYNLNVRISSEERKIFDDYCDAVERTQSDVIREFIRSLQKKTKKSQDVT